jgi:hypothetical protein
MTERRGDVAKRSDSTELAEPSSEREKGAPDDRAIRPSMET